MLRKLAYSLLCLSLSLQNLILAKAETENQTDEVNEHFVHITQLPPSLSKQSRHIKAKPPS